MTPLEQAWHDRLARGPLILDGATGTELERRGAGGPPPLWSATALLASPEVVQAVHAEYVAAGADIIVANTFRTNPRALAAAGRLDAGAELNRRAVELVRRAAAAGGRATGPGTRASERASAAGGQAGAAGGRSGQSVFVAASVAPAEDCYSPERVPDEATLRTEHEQMAAWVRAAGADLAWIETMGTVREARGALAAARAQGLPAAVSFVLREDGALLGGEPLAAAVAAVTPLGPLALGLNCIPPTGLTRLLPRLRVLTELPLAAYAHIGNARPIRGWSFAEDATPAQYAQHARAWLAAGAQIVGGCCGTNAVHVREMAGQRDLGIEGLGD